MTKMTKKVKEDNYTAVLLEDIRDQVKILAEGQIGIRDNVEILRSDVSTLKSDVSTLKSDVSTLKSDLAEFKEDTKQNFKIITDYLMRLEDEIVALRKELEGVKDGSIPVGNMVSMNERLSFVENEIAELKTAQA
jgi:archaellum component FlaC